MATILEKLKGKDLFTQLKEHYPAKNVAPFGKVLQIPNRDFKAKWKDELESHGIKTYVEAVDGQSVFLVKLEEADKPDVEPEKTLAKPSIVKRSMNFWTPEKNARLAELLSQKKTPKEIAEKLGCSVFMVGGKVKALKQQAKNAAEASHSDAEISELLSAATLIFSTHRHASVCLLKEACARMENYG